VPVQQAVDGRAMAAPASSSRPRASADSGVDSSIGASRLLPANGPLRVTASNLPGSTTTSSRSALGDQVRRSTAGIARCIHVRRSGEDRSAARHGRRSNGATTPYAAIVQFFTGNDWIGRAETAVFSTHGLRVAASAKARFFSSRRTGGSNRRSTFDSSNSGRTSATPPVRSARRGDGRGRSRRSFARRSDDTGVG
jgi:hypothetical protein